MFWQLGNIIFDGIFAPDTVDKTVSSSFAQHDLINGKPTLKPTGQNLEEITVVIRLRAEFINVAQALLSLQNSVDSFEVLPLVKGSGQFVGEYIINEFSISEKQALPDGTVVDAQVSLTLLEYVTADKLQQQQVAARKKAFALGDKDPFALNIQQNPTVPQLAATDLSAVNSQASVIDADVSQYENNVSGREGIAARIQRGLDKMDTALEEFNNRLDEITILDDIAGIIQAVAVVRQTIEEFIFPVTSIDDLKRNNRDLQNVTRSLGSSTKELVNLVITRRA